MEDITRRNFIISTAKFLTATATFGLVPGIVEAKKKKKSVPKFTIPALTEFKTLSELNEVIGDFNLQFSNDMALREGLGAIVIHHAGLARGDIENTTAEIHDMHLNNGWAGIGYHFVVHKDGSIDRARPIEFAGAHAYKNNDYTVGICMTGNYDIALPPIEQVLATEQLVAAICHEYDIEPSDETIFGHRQLCLTSCPGEKFYPYLPTIIKNMQEVL